MGNRRASSILARGTTLRPAFGRCYEWQASLFVRTGESLVAPREARAKWDGPGHFFLLNNLFPVFYFRDSQKHEVETKQLVRAVKRNLSRFPADFMFQLSYQEVRNLRCQFGTSSLQAPEITENRNCAHVFSLAHGGTRHCDVVVGAVKPAGRGC